MNIQGKILKLKKIPSSQFCSRRIPITDSLFLRNQYDEIIDVRSELEYLDDHIPGALNFPVLTTHEWQMVGTLNRADKFESKKKGAFFVARNISNHLDSHFIRCVMFIHFIYVSKFYF